MRATEGEEGKKPLLFFENSDCKSFIHTVLFIYHLVHQLISFLRTQSQVHTQQLTG